MSGYLPLVEEVLRNHGWERGDAEKVNYKLKSVSFHNGQEIAFEQPGVTVIAGANNCGKSTLLAELHNALLNGQDAKGKLVASATQEPSGDVPDFLDWLLLHAKAQIDPNSIHSAQFQRLEHAQALGGFLNSYQPPQMQHFIRFFVKYLGAGNRHIQDAAAKPGVLFPSSDPLHLLHERKDMMDELNELTYRIFKKRLHLDDLNQQYKLRVGTPTLPRPLRQYEDETAYQLEVEALPALSEQGDGMRSLLNILIPLVTATYPILIVDEPEAFLHPPQAFALGQELGKIASAKGIQVVVATHDRNILAGLVNADAPLSVVRLVREHNDNTKAHQLRSEALRAIMKDPVLKYSHVLDGLFHEVAVLAEAERDCRFYEAALEAYEDRLSTDSSDDAPVLLPVSEVLFIPTSGTSNMPRLATALRSLNVPVIACPDLDVLDNRAVLKNIVEAVGGDWSSLDGDWQSVVSPLSAVAPAEHVVTVGARVQGAFKALADADPFAEFDGDARRRIAEAMKAQSRPWDEVKHHGIQELLRVNVRNPEAVPRLIDGLSAQRVVVVHVGELESFGHELGEFKGKRWLPAALSANIQKGAKAQEQIRRLLEAAVPLTSWAK